MNTYYISAEMLGDEATDDDARRMVKILEARGYDAEYGHPRSYQSDDDIATKDWEEGLDIISREKYATE